MNDTNIQLMMLRIRGNGAIAKRVVKGDAQCDSEIELGGKHAGISIQVMPRERYALLKETSDGKFQYMDGTGMLRRDLAVFMAQ